MADQVEVHREGAPRGQGQPSPLGAVVFNHQSACLNPDGERKKQNRRDSTSLRRANYTTGAYMTTRRLTNGRDP